MSTEPLLSLLWRGLDQPSLQLYNLRRSGAGHAMDGALIGSVDDQILECHYRIECDADWVTRTVSIQLEQPAGDSRGLELRRDQQGRWWRDGSELHEFRNIADIDLSITPASNTLPIRRIDLDVGEHADVTALWVGFPELVLEPLPQRYTRISQHTYRYESEGGAFTADLQVDDLGVMVRYGELWVRTSGRLFTS